MGGGWVGREGGGGAWAFLRKGAQSTEQAGQGFLTARGRVARPWLFSSVSPSPSNCATYSAPSTIGHDYKSRPHRDRAGRRTEAAQCAHHRAMELMRLTPFRLSNGTDCPGGPAGLRAPSRETVHVHLRCLVAVRRMLVHIPRFCS